MKGICTCLKRVSCNLLLITAFSLSSLVAVALTAVLPRLSLTSNERWRNPCGGGTEEEEDFAARAHAQNRLTTSESDTFAQLSQNSLTLQELVNDLKNRYVQTRFRDATVADEWLQSGFELQGMPTYDTTTPVNRTTHAVLLRSYENLSRLAVYVAQVRQSEERPEANETPLFITELRNIEDNHEAGIYIIMCRLYNMMRTEQIDLSDETLHEIRNIPHVGAELPTNAIRHGRDYVVLHHLLTLAEKLNEDFNSQ